MKALLRKNPSLLVNHFNKMISPRPLRFMSTKKVDNYALAVNDCKIMDTAFASQLFEMLKISSFSEKELKRSFDEADLDKNGSLSKLELVAMMETLKIQADESKILHNLDQHVDMLMVSLDANKDGKVTFDEFKSRMLFLGERRDPRVWPISGSMLIVGISVGVMLPVMPQLVTQLGMTSADYGYVVSAFALSKLFGNIPAAFGVDKYGRKPMLICGVGVLGLSMFIFSHSSCLEHLIAARLIGGLGVAAFSSAATMTVTDLSTSLNRARMMAPLVASFSAGSLAGPAVGGYLYSVLGAFNTFYVVGETLPPWRNKFKNDKRTLSQEFVSTVKEWGPLWKQKDLRQVCILNTAYWFSLSGSSMTLLPLILVSDRFGFTPLEVGGIFAFQSGISVLFTPFSAYLIDKFGARRIMPISLGIVSTGMALFPLASDTPQALAVLGLWALGGTLLGSAPSTFTANNSTTESRTQSLALLRTAGDCGMLLGAASVGTLALLTSETAAMQISASFLLAVNAWFIFQTTKKNV